MLFITITRLLLVGISLSSMGCMVLDDVASNVVENLQDPDRKIAYDFQVEPGLTPAQVKAVVPSVYRLAAESAKELEYERFHQDRCDLLVFVFDKGKLTFVHNISMARDLRENGIESSFKDCKHVPPCWKKLSN